MKTRSSVSWLVTVIVFTCLFISTSIAETVDLHSGTVELPPTFKHARDQGEDSIVGHILSPDGRLVIRYDVGPMAGVYATISKYKDVISSGELLIGESTALFVVFGQEPQTIIISFPEIGPTNLFAEVHTREEIDTVKKLAMTFKPKLHDQKR